LMYGCQFKHKDRYCWQIRNIDDLKCDEHSDP
jgi:hypothetical protein